MSEIFCPNCATKDEETQFYAIKIVTPLYPLSEHDTEVSLCRKCYQALIEPGIEAIGRKS